MTYSGIEWGSDRRKRTIESKAASFSRLAGDAAAGIIGGKNSHSLRSMGSAAMNYAMVAQGALDIYWYSSISNISHAKL
jgi:myo-inositol-1(or 4)-monophosphatase